MVGQSSYDDTESFNIVDIDWSFGLADTFPGLNEFLTLTGPIDFWKGFISGSEVGQNESLDLCDVLIQEEFISNIQMW